MLFKVKPKDENRINMKKKYRFKRKREMGYILQKSCDKNKLFWGEHLKT